MLQIGGFALGTIAEIEAATRALRATLKPADYGALGSYAKAMRNGGTVMAAGLGAAAPIFSFRYGGANLCQIRRIKMSAAAGVTAFAAGSAMFDFFVARAFTASDTGGVAGSVAGNYAKLKSAMAASSGVADFRISQTATLTAVTRTLDADPFASLIGGVPVVAGQSLIPPNTAVFNPAPGEDLLTLAQNEGFVCQATVPATGVWNFSIAVEWGEYVAVVP